MPLNYGSNGSWMTVNHRRVADTDWRDPVQVAWLAHELWKGRDYKAEFEKQAAENGEMLRGNHRARWDKLTNRVVPNPVKADDRWRAKLIYNETGAQEEYRRAVYTQNDMSWTTTVGTDDLGDKSVNRLTDQVMGSHWELMGMDDVVDELVQWCQSSAKCYLHEYWGASAGPYMRTTLQDYLYGAEEIADPVEKQDYIREQTNRFFQQFGQQALQQGFYEGPIGMPKIDVAPIFEVIEYPFFAKSEKQTTIKMRTIRMGYREAAQMLGTSVEELRSITKQASKAHEASQSSPWNLEYFFEEDGSASQNDDSMFLHIIYHTVCRDYPKGRFAMVPHGAEQAFGGVKDIPNPIGEIPIIECVEKPIRGSRYGTCLVDQIRSPNENINTVASLMSDYITSRVAPTCLRGTGAGAKRLTVKPGAVLDVTDPNSAFSFLEAPQVPADMFASINQDRSWISTLGGVTSSDYGQNSSGVDSARGLMVQQQASRTRLGPFARRLAQCVSKAGCFVLADLQDKCITERIVELIGDENRGEVVNFRGEDLQPSNYMKPGYNKNCVKVSGLGVLPRSPNEVMNFLKMAIETQNPNGETLLDPKIDRSEILEMIGMGAERHLFDRERMDVLKCRKLIKAYEAGQFMRPDLALKNEDEHDVFIRELERWKKTDDFKVANVKFQPMPPAFPGLEYLVDQRIENHRIAKTRKLVEPQYLAVRADISLWMQHRSELTQQLAASGMDPDMINFIVSTSLAAPFSAANAMQQHSEAQQAEQEQSAKDAKEDKKEGKPGRPKESSGSENQGVTKEQQAAEKG